MNDDPQGKFDFSTRKTKTGVPCDEAASALQKAIRRGEEDEALHWAADLYRAGFGSYVFRRCVVIASEDVGLGWVEGPAVIAALQTTFEATKKREKERPPERSNAMLPLIHSVLLLTRAPKSRLVDDACAVYCVAPLEARAVPSWAVDQHTARGRREGLGSHEQSYAIANEAPIENPYASAARAIDCQQG